MASTDFRIAGTGANVVFGGVTAWTNPTRIALNDGSGASITLASGVPGDALSSSIHSVGVNTTSTIIGIEVKTDALVNQFDSVQVLLATDATLTKFTASKFITGGTSGEITLGGASDLWTGVDSSAGYLGFTGIEVNAGAFGVFVVPATEAGTNTLTIDYVAVKLYISDAFAVSPVPMLGGGSC